MRRLSLVAAVIAAGTLSGPSLAVADGSAMCAAGTVPASLPAWLVEATQDTTAQLAPSRPLSDDDILWCASADDPRCVPLRTDADGIMSALAHGLVAPVLTDRASVPRPPVARLVREAALGGPREGTHARLDRPPRG